MLHIKSFLQGLPAGLDALATELVLGPLTQLNVNRRVERPYNDKLNLAKCNKPKQTHIFQNVAIPSIFFSVFTRLSGCILKSVWRAPLILTGRPASRCSQTHTAPLSPKVDSEYALPTSAPIPGNFFNNFPIFNNFRKV